MTSPSRSTSLLRLSLRELLLVLAFVGVGCAGFKYAGEMWWTVLSTVVLVIFLAAAVVAVVGRGPAQARAIGFGLCAGLYFVLLYAAPSAPNGRPIDVDPFSRLPTTMLLNRLHRLIGTTTYMDMRTREVILDYDPTSNERRPVGATVKPDRAQFMAIGHLLWAVAIGYLGSRFAGWVYSRSEAREERSSPG